MRGEVSEDFPNGGSVRGYLFTVDGPQGPFSWFFQNSASAVDFSIPIVVDGVDYGSPINGAGVQLLKPGQYMDKWRLDRNGVKPIENTAVKRALGFSNVQAFRQ